MGLIRLDVSKIDSDVLSLDQGLHERVIGQDPAIKTIVSAYQIYLAGLQASNRPIRTFLFLGPTGSGKTRIVEATAEIIFGNPKALIKIDCAEFQQSHEISKLVGAPPGFVGHLETPPLLSQERLSKYQTEKIKVSFVLFDEVEKANFALWNLMLGILDKAVLTLGKNQQVDFSQVMIFMTSNLASGEMQDILTPKMGFQSVVPVIPKSFTLDNKLREKLSRVGTAAARKRFAPEFFNRIDEVVTFNPLGEQELRKILDIELCAVQQRILLSPVRKRFTLTLTQSAKNFLLERGTDLKSGARNLKRAIEKFLVDPLSTLKSSGEIGWGEIVIVDLDTKSGELKFSKEVEEPRKKVAKAKSSVATVSKKAMEATASGTYD